MKLTDDQVRKLRDQAVAAKRINVVVLCNTILLKAKGQRDARRALLAETNTDGTLR